MSLCAEVACDECGHRIQIAEADKTDEYVVQGWKTAWYGCPGCGAQVEAGERCLPKFKVKKSKRKKIG